MRPCIILFLSAFVAVLLGCGSEDASEGGTTSSDAGSESGGDDASRDVAPEATEDVESDAGVADATLDVGNDAQDATLDVKTDAPSNLTPMGTLDVDCEVPFVLDASQVTNATYMAGHFSDLVQEYGITGVIGGEDVTAFPEKMYYGTHSPASATPNDVLSLLQLSMTSVTVPSFSVRIDFRPDTQVTAGSMWPVGLEAGKAPVLLFAHPTSSSLCTFSVGMGGSLTFSEATDVTQLEGGSFTVTGTIEMVEPADVPDFCDAMANLNAPCCS